MRAYSPSEEPKGFGRCNNKAFKRWRAKEGNGEE